VVYLLRQFKDNKMQVLNIEKLSAVCGGDTMPVAYRLSSGPGDITASEQKVLDSMNRSIGSARAGADKDAWIDAYCRTYEAFLED
jgi:hypothetical protein